MKRSIRPLAALVVAGCLVGSGLGMAPASASPDSGTIMRTATLAKPTPKKSTPSKPVLKGEAFPACLNRSAVITKGHVDLAAGLSGNQLTFTVKDDSRTLANTMVHRDPQAVALRADAPNKVQRKGPLADAAWSFLGEAGSTAYVLPQVQKPSLVWPGYSTEAVDYQAIKGPVTLSLDSVQSTSGGKVTMFSTNMNGKPTVLLDTDSHKSLPITEARHSHASWAFTKPGIYDLGLRYSTVGKDGKQLTTGTKVVRVSVATTTC